MPYLLQLYDSNRFYGMPGLHINRLETGGFSIPVPYSQQMKIHDLLDYIGIENNTSFYINQGGKKDLVLKLQWHEDFKRSFQKHLSGVKVADLIKR